MWIICTYFLLMPTGGPGAHAIVGPIFLLSVRISVGPSLSIAVVP